MAIKKRGVGLLKLLAKAILPPLFGVLMAWLMVEIFVRVAFDALPADAQNIVQHVQRVPWDETHIVPPLPFISSFEHQARLAPNHEDYPVRWGDARFTSDTLSLWDMPVGFRTDEPRWPVQIVTIGDSFTFCWTDYEDCWVQALQTEFGYSVMNLGVPGTGALAHQSLIEPYVKPLEPQLIVWQWYGNDYKDDYDFMRIRGEVEELTQPTDPPPVQDYGTLADYSALYRLIREWQYQRENPRDPEGFVIDINDESMFFFDEANSYDLSYGSVQYGVGRGLASIADSYAIFQNDLNADMLIVLIPSKEEVYASYLGEYFDTAYFETLAEGRELLLAECESQSWYCLDLTTALTQAAVADAVRVYHAFDFHLNAAGNRIVADEVARFIQEQGLLDG